MNVQHWRQSITRVVLWRSACVEVRSSRSSHIVAALVVGLRVAHDLKHVVQRQRPRARCLINLDGALVLRALLASPGFLALNQFLNFSKIDRP